MYIIQDGDINIHVDMDDIISLLNEWDAEYCTAMPSMFHMREYNILKSQIHDPETTMYTEALSGEHVDEYYKVVDENNQSLMRRDTFF